MFVYTVDSVIRASSLLVEQCLWDRAITKWSHPRGPPGSLGIFPNPGVGGANKDFSGKNLIK